MRQANKQTDGVSWAFPRRLAFVLALTLAFAGFASAQALTITTTSLPGGVTGVPYPPQALTATGGSGSYGAPGANCALPGVAHWCITSGSLGALSLSTDGVISGTPAAGTLNFTVQVTDSLGATQQKSLSIVVTDLLVITTASLPNATFGSAYSAPLSTTGGTLPFTWTPIAGALPQGLSINPTNGVISGTPTSGTSTFTVRAVDSSIPPQSFDAPLSITVLPIITTTSLPNGAVGVAYIPQTLTVGGGVAPFSNWTVPPNTLPPGLALSAAGVINGTPTTPGTFTFTIGVSDSTAPAAGGPFTASKQLTIVVQPPLVILTATPLPPAVAGSFYGLSFTASGPSPVVWSFVSGVQPPGLGLSSSGTLSGVASNFPQTYVFTVQASGGNPLQTVQQSFSLTYNPSLSITTSVLQPVTKGVAFSTNLTATGGNAPYTWTSLIALPPGVNLSPAGVLSGNPPTTGSFALSIQVSDSSAPVQTSSRVLTLTVTNVLAVATTTLPDGEAGKPYTQNLTTVAGSPPFTWVVQAGTLPSGMSLQPDGTLTGTPAATSVGTYNFTVNVTDSFVPPQAATKDLTLKILPPLDITGPSLLPLGVVSVFYSKQIPITSGQTTLVWTTTGGLPPGILLSQSSGLLSGFPTTAGTFDFTVKVDGTNPVQTTQRALRIVVNDRLTISTPVVLPDASLGVDYSQSLVAAGGLSPYTWTNPGGVLPSGLTLSSTGVLSGKPVGTGTYAFSIQVDDSFTPMQTVRTTFTLRVNNNIQISTASLPNATQNLAYSQQLLTVGGAAPLTWVVSAGTLPTNITLSPAGLLSGTPTVLETKSVTIAVTDSRGLSASKDFVLTVDPPLPALSAPGFPATMVPATSANVTFSLASPYPSPLSGRLVLTFISKAEVPADDPMTRFSDGTRSVTFTIPANSTAAVFNPPVSVTAGTVAGTVRLAAFFDNGPQDVTVTTTEIGSTAPQMTRVLAVRTIQGFEVQITGYSTSRRVISAEFTFDLNVGGKAAKQTVTANVGASFATWFTSPSSIQFGGTFSYVQTFDYAGGNVNDVQAVTVRLTNAQGSTTSQVIPFK